MKTNANSLTHTFLNGIAKGDVTTAIDAKAATTTSNEIDCRGFNSIIVESIVSGTGNWALDVMGCAVTGGTFGDCYSQQDAGTFTKMTVTQNADGTRNCIFKGIPNYVKIEATRTAGTITVKVTPINL